MTDDEIRQVATFFVHDGPTNPNVKYSLYHGRFNALPNFKELKSVAQGECVGFDLSVADRPGEYAIRFSTTVRVAIAGEYRFWLVSDDGSRLTIDQQTVIDNDGVHPRTMNPGAMKLDVGVHQVIVDYFQESGESLLLVSMALEDQVRQTLPAFAFLESGGKSGA